jgi:hypothetical protein
MTYADLFLVVVGFGCSLVIGLCAGLLIGRRLTMSTVSATPDESRLKALQQELNGWDRWYAQHMPACALLEQSNREGMAALAEWEQAQ